MWTILIQFSFSFLATAAFAIITNVPRSALAWCGFSGALGWMIYWVTITFGGNAAFGSLLGSLGVAFISDVFSKNSRCRSQFLIFLEWFHWFLGASLSSCPQFSHWFLSRRDYIRGTSNYDCWCNCFRTSFI